MQEPLLTEDSYLFVPSRPWPPEPVSPVLDRAWNGFLVPDSRLWHVNEAWTILEAAAVKFKPRDIFLLFSGGYDSLVATHLSMLLLDDTFRKYASHFGDFHPNVHVLHINTGIGIPETRDYVRTVTHGFRWHYLEYTTPESYEESCLTYGFPGPAQHFRMYSRLKERALRIAVRDHTPPHPLSIHQQELYELLNDMRTLPLPYQYALIRLVRRYLSDAIKEYREQLRPILFVTGVRRLESARRMGNVVPWQKQGRHWWLSPLTSWSKDQVLDYRDAYKLPHNIVVDLLHKSGECLCGSFAKAQELEEVCCFFPEVGEYIKDLERRVWQSGFHWRWEEGPPKRKGRQRVDQNQLVLPGFEDTLSFEEIEEQLPQMGFSPLCSSCNARFEREHLHPRVEQNTSRPPVV